MVKLIPCKECSESIDVTSKEMEETLKYLVKNRNIELVDHETSSERVSLCLSCSAYAHGGTCMYCGCLVQIKTKIQGQQCPHPSQPKW